MLIDYQEQKAADIYRLMSQSIIPRPIAWVITEDDGVVNIAPFSYFTALSSNPPTMIFSVGHKSDGSPKDTLSNLRKHRKCTVCMVEESHLEAMHFSSKELAHAQSEAETFAIATVGGAEGFPPMIENAPVAFFCELYQEIALAESKTIPLIVEVKQQFVDEKSLCDTDRLSISYKPVARVGKRYAFLGEEIVPPSIP